MTGTNENKLRMLEERIAHQDKTIEELSEQLSRQWKQIDGLTQAVKQFSAQIAELEETVVPSAPVTKPPHW